MKTFHFILAGAGICLLAMAGCVSPSVPMADPSSLEPVKNGRQVLEASAKKQGNDLRRFQKVEVSYDGKWSTFPKLTQRVLVDPDFRGRSQEVYLPAQNLVEQTHRGPGGEKAVRRVQGKSIAVSYNGEADTDSEVEASAALVADAYAMFLFGSSWLLKQGDEFRYLGQSEVEGIRCDFVEVTVSPGFGLSKSDRAVAAIDAESGLMRRVGFTMNGLESTQTAEVDVTFDQFFTAPDGSQWPGHFVEFVRKPVNAKAHDWRMTSLVLDGRKAK